MSLVFDQRFLKFIIELEAASGQDLEDGVAIIFEVEDIITSFVLDLDISKTLSSE